MSIYKINFMNSEWERDYILTLDSLQERGYKIEYHALDSAVVIGINQYDYLAQEALTESARWFAIDGINADVEQVTLFDMETLHNDDGYEFDDSDWRWYETLRG